MEISITKNEKQLVLLLKGRLDTTTAPQLQAALTEQWDGINSLILDLETLDYVSSAGLRVILFAQKHMNQLKGQMIVRNVCATIMEIFELTGFTDILTVQ